MASLPQGISNWSISCDRASISVLGISDPPLIQPRTRPTEALAKARVTSQSSFAKGTSYSPRKGFSGKISKKVVLTIPRCSSSPKSNASQDDSSGKGKVAFGNTRKDVLLIGVGVTVVGVGLKYGLESFGVDPLQAGNVVQLVLVLGLTIGWISTYIFRVSNKEMTYAQQLRDYEDKVMQKRLEGLTEAELEALLEQVEEDKRRQSSRKQVN